MEFLLLEHAGKGFARPEHLDLQVYPFRLHTAIDERPRAIVVPAREREGQPGHRGPPDARVLYFIGQSCTYASPRSLKIVPMVLLTSRPCESLPTTRR